MNISYAKILIERAKSSLKSSNDDTYKEAIQAKIEQLEYAICFDQKVDDISCAQNTHEVPSHLILKVRDLEQSI